MRALLVFLVLALSLNIIAHAAHPHAQDFAAGGPHTVFCDYCVAFGATADGPVHTLAIRAPGPAEPLLVLSSESAQSCAPVSSAQPRAPPSLS